MITGPSHKEVITIINVYAHNNNFKILEGNFNRTKVRKRHIHNYSWEFYHPLSETNRTTRQIISKEIRGSEQYYQPLWPNWHP